MGQLRHDLRAARCRRRGESLEPAQRVGVLRAVDGDIPGAFEIAAIDLDIPGQQQRGAAGGPAPINRFQPQRRAVRLVGEPFGHRRLDEPVFQPDAAGKRDRIGDGHSHGTANLKASKVNGARPFQPDSMLQVVELARALRSLVRNRNCPCTGPPAKAALKTGGLFHSAYSASRPYFFSAACSRSCGNSCAV